MGRCSATHNMICQLHWAWYHLITVESSFSRHGVVDLHLHTLAVRIVAIPLFHCARSATVSASHRACAYRRMHVVRLARRQASPHWRHPSPPDHAAVGSSGKGCSTTTPYPLPPAHSVFCRKLHGQAARSSSMPLDLAAQPCTLRHETCGQWAVAEMIRQNQEACPWFLGCAHVPTRVHARARHRAA